MNDEMKNDLAYLRRKSEENQNQCCAGTPKVPNTTFFSLPFPEAKFPAAVHRELHRARFKHSRPFLSAHEGIAIIREEYLEVEHEVFHGVDRSKLAEELIQLAAMCQRMVEDLSL